MDVIRQTVFQLEAAHTTMKQKYALLPRPFLLNLARITRVRARNFKAARRRLAEWKPRIANTVYSRAPPGTRTKSHGSHGNWIRGAAPIMAARHRRNLHPLPSGMDPGISSAV